MSPAAFGLSQWLCWIRVLQMHARWRKYWLGSLHKSKVSQSSISCWAHRHDQHGLFYLGHWTGAVLSMWSMRPELLPMWMGLLPRLTGRLRRGQPVASHSVSALHQHMYHPDPWPTTFILIHGWLSWQDFVVQLRAWESAHMHDAFTALHPSCMTFHPQVMSISQHGTSRQHR